jgi:hypothetical protein
MCFIILTQHKFSAWKNENLAFKIFQWKTVIARKINFLRKWKKIDFSSEVN